MRMHFKLLIIASKQLLFIQVPLCKDPYKNNIQHSSTVPTFFMNALATFMSATSAV